MLAIVFNGIRRGGKEQMGRRVSAGSWQDPLGPKSSSCVGREENEAQGARAGRGEWVVTVVVMTVQSILIRMFAYP